jgi:lantibiotic modifying enzyme
VVTDAATIAEQRTSFDAALTLARRLAREAIWHDGSCTWLGDDMADDAVVVHRSMAGDLYGGTSGIGWFLAAVSAVSGDDEVADAARGALRHSLLRTEDSSDDGLYTGRIGVALAAAAGGTRLDDGNLVERGAALGAAAARSVLRAPPVDPDLMSGVAGAILGLLGLSRTLDDGTAAPAALALGEQLVDWTERELAPSAPSTASAGDPVLCGLGHGASGPALALFELEASAGDARFGESARAALAYERAWFSREECGWPDLRGLDRGQVEAGAKPVYSIGWCHGAAGIGLVRLRAFELTGDLTLLAEAAAAVDSATIGALSAVGSRRRSPTDISLCHGVGSVIELHLVAAEVTGDREHVAHARRIWRWALRGRNPDGEADDDVRNGSEPVLPTTLPCGVPGGGEAPGLMLGLAGIGALGLRLHDPASIPSPLQPGEWLRERSSAPS